MNLQNLKQNLSNQLNKETLTTLLQSLQEVSDKWSSSIFTAIRLIGSLAGLVALIAVIIVSTQWFISTYGIANFVFTLVVSTFVVSVLTTFSAKQREASPPAKTTRTKAK